MSQRLRLNQREAAQHSAHRRENGANRKCDRAHDAPKSDHAHSSAYAESHDTLMLSRTTEAYQPMLSRRPAGRLQYRLRSRRLRVDPRLHHIISTNLPNAQRGRRGLRGATRPRLWLNDAQSDGADLPGGRRSQTGMGLRAPMPLEHRQSTCQRRPTLPGLQGSGALPTTQRCDMA